MIKLDEQLLYDLGLRDLLANHKNVILQAIYSELEGRVGASLVARMSDQQLDEFEAFTKAKDDPGAFHWLESNFPEYKSVVQDEFAKLRVELSDDRDAVVALSTLYVAKPGQVIAQRPSSSVP